MADVDGCCTCGDGNMGRCGSTFAMRIVAFGMGDSDGETYLWSTTVCCFAFAFGDIPGYFPCCTDFFKAAKEKTISVVTGLVGSFGFFHSDNL